MEFDHNLPIFLPLILLKPFEYLATICMPTGKYNFRFPRCKEVQLKPITPILDPFPYGNTTRCRQLKKISVFIFVYLFKPGNITNLHLANSYT